MENREQVISDFEKQTNLLNDEQVKKIIPNMDSKSMQDLCKDKKRSGAFVVIDNQSNFVLMFFYHADKGMRAVQYVVGKDIVPDGALILCGLFSEYVLKVLNMAKVKTTHEKFKLAEFYNRQIAGYKEFLKKEKQ